MEKQRIGRLAVFGSKEGAYEDRREPSPDSAQLEAPRARQLGQSAQHRACEPTPDGGYPQPSEVAEADYAATLR